LLAQFCDLDLIELNEPLNFVFVARDNKRCLNALRNILINVVPDFGGGQVN
jgi:hypothetical protein